MRGRLAGAYFGHHHAKIAPTISTYTTPSMTCLKTLFHGWPHQIPFGSGPKAGAIYSGNGARYS